MAAKPNSKTNVKPNKSIDLDADKLLGFIAGASKAGSSKTGANKIGVVKPGTSKQGATKNGFAKPAR
jgi:hypothetical protein